MKTLANWNGIEMPLQDVLIPAMDRAFIFGDAAYEVVRIFEGRLWRLSDHMTRLTSTLSQLQIDFAVDTVRQRLQQTLENSGEREAIAYIQVTRGTAGKRAHHFPSATQPNCLIYIEHFDDPSAPLRESGASAVSHKDIRWKRNDLKVTSLLANCLAAEAAHAQGCLEAIMFRDGILTEGSRTSVFGVKDGTLIAYPVGPAVLPGITKKQVLELCRSKAVPVSESHIAEADIFNMDELFITGTTIQIVPITQLDGKPIGDGKPGSVTRKLQQGFQESVAAWLADAKTDAGEKAPV